MKHLATIALFLVGTSCSGEFYSEAYKNPCSAALPAEQRPVVLIKILREVLGEPCRLAKRS
jgi:hypothetical protein